MDRLARALDILVVVLLGSWAQWDVWSGAAASVNGLEGGPWLHAVLAVVITLPLLLRLRYPVAVVIVVSAATWLQYSLGGGLPQPWFAILLASYSLAAHAGMPLSVVGMTPVAAALLAVDIPRLGNGAPVEDVVPVWAVTALVWGAGRWVRSRRREAADLQARAHQLETEREQVAQAAVAEERARISRELHDLVAHSMSVINLQAQGAQTVLRHDSDAAAAALGEIERESRQGLDEMRRLVAVLRTGDRADALTPNPGLSNLPGLVERVRSAGLDAQLQITAEEVVLPAGVELAVYRVAQEALTNALKHGHGGTAMVHLAINARAVELTVTSTARDGGDQQRVVPGTGRGLIGMQERVAFYGGALQAGPLPGGEFVVRALLPIGEAL